MTDINWKAALDIRAREAEEKHLAGEPLTEDIVVVALVHPDKFEVMVRIKDD